MRTWTNLKRTVPLRQRLYAKIVKYASRLWRKQTRNTRYCRRSRECWCSDAILPYVCWQMYRVHADSRGRRFVHNSLSRPPLSCRRRLGDLPRRLSPSQPGSHRWSSRVLLAVNWHRCLPGMRLINERWGRDISSIGEIVRKTALWEKRKKVMLGIYAMKRLAAGAHGFLRLRNSQMIESTTAWAGWCEGRVLLFWFWPISF